MRRFWRHLRRKLIAGLLVILPIVAVVWLLYTFFTWIDGILSPAIWRGVYTLWGELTILGVSIGCTPGQGCQGPPGAGFITTALLIYIVGVLATNILGRQAVTWLDRIFARFPVVGGVYTAVKQVLQAISNSSSSSFKRVVLIEFPAAGTWTVGFVTGELKDKRGEYLSVFVATAPNPTTGYAMVVRKDRAVKTSMTVEEGFKFLMSAGVVRPEQLADEPLPPHQDAGTPAVPGDKPVLEEVAEVAAEENRG